MRFYIIAGILLLAVSAPIAQEVALDNAEPFGRAAYLAPEGMLWNKWRQVQADIDRDAPLVAVCRNRLMQCSSDAALRFAAIADQSAQLSGRERLKGVNRAVNGAIVFANDISVFGRADYWAPPLESLAAGRGDCEEFAIAKYAILRDTEWPADDLRLVIVRDDKHRAPHMLAAARHEGRWFILDNSGDDLAEDRALPHLLPVFILDRRGVLQIGPPSPPGGFRLGSETGCREQAG